MKKLMRLDFFKIFSLVIITGLPLFLNAQDVKEGDEVNLRLALPFNVLDDLTQKDAQLAMDMWIREVVQSMEKRTSIHFNASAVFLENDYSQVNLKVIKKYDILVLGALDFFDFNFEESWEPIALTGTEGHFPEEYLVLARKDKKFKNIGDLRGKQLAFTKNQDERIVLYWLDCLLRTKNLGRVDTFFKLQEAVSKESKAVLNVFFNKVDACVVGYNQFQTMVELNPQIGRDIIIIAESPPFARGMVCLKKTLDKQIKKNIKEAVLELPKYQRGKQILAFFGQSNLITPQPEYLESFRELVQSSRKLDKK